MPRYKVNVRCSIECNVEVDADTPEKAANELGDVNIPLPPGGIWSGCNDWWFRVYDDNDAEVYDC